MIFFGNRFPYTTVNDINLDWIIKKVKALGGDVEQYAADIETAQATADAAQTTADAAQTTADAAQAAADTAQATAEAAQDAADAAQATADGVETALARKQDAPTTPGDVGQVLGLDASLNPVWVNQSGGTGGTSNYNALTNKPSINSVTLAGNKTAADLGLATESAVQAAQTDATSAAGIANSAVGLADLANRTANSALDGLDDKQDAPVTAGTAGQVLGLNASLEPVWITPTTGSTNYTELTNKPSVNGVTLAGNKTAADLGLATESAVQTAQSDATAAQTTANTALANAASAYSLAQSAFAIYKTAVPISATTGDIATVTDARITAACAVAEITFDNPSAIASDITWTTSANTLVLNGTCTAATTANIVIVKI